MASSKNTLTCYLFSDAISKKEQTMSLMGRSLLAVPPKYLLENHNGHAGLAY